MSEMINTEDDFLNDLLSDNKDVKNKPKKDYTDYELVNSFIKITDCKTMKFKDNISPYIIFKPLVDPANPKESFVHVYKHSTFFSKEDKEKYGLKYIPFDSIHCSNDEGWGKGFNSKNYCPVETMCTEIYKFIESNPTHPSVHKMTAIKTKFNNAIKETYTNILLIDSNIESLKPYIGKIMKYKVPQKFLTDFVKIKKEKKDINVFSPNVDAIKIEYNPKSNSPTDIKYDFYIDFADEYANKTLKDFVTMFKFKKEDFVLYKLNSIYQLSEDKRDSYIEETKSLLSKFIYNSIPELCANAQFEWIKNIPLSFNNDNIENSIVTSLTTDNKSKLVHSNSENIFEKDLNSSDDDEDIFGSSSSDDDSFDLPFN